MDNFYFTFGSDPAYPYGREDYVLIRASDISEAARVFKTLHPNRPKTNCLNCAFFYNEAQWQKEVKRHYAGREPVEEVTITRRGR